MLLNPLSKRSRSLFVAVVACAVALCGVATGESLRLVALFSDHAVLQQRATVPVWGWGAAGDEVTVSIAGQAHTTLVDSDGHWQVELDPMDAGGPHAMGVTAGEETLSVDDILIGEVWLASGQSNMRWSIKQTDNYEEELLDCANDVIRFVKVHQAYSAEPLDEPGGLEPWFICNRENLLSCNNDEGYSAVSYYFAKYLQAELGVPVGVINTCWGGTPIEPWTPVAGFEQVPALDAIVQRIHNKEHIEEGAPHPHKAPTVLFNAMVAPLVPYANRGFLWYQGESNVGDGMVYRDKMEALIKGWRTAWQQDDLACYFVQLAPFGYKHAPTVLPEMWEAQTAALALPHTGMAVINDVGDVDDIHPRNKDDVGKRLAHIALEKTYGREDIEGDSPRFDRFEVDGDTMRVYFDHAKELSTRDGAAPTWFFLAGEDGEYHEAEAVIDGATVVLRAEGLENPVAVRFAWDQTAEPNLVNEAGLPTSAFRSE